MLTLSVGIFKSLHLYWSLNWSCRHKYSKIYSSFVYRSSLLIEQNIFSAKYSHKLMVLIEKIAFLLSNLGYLNT